MIDFKKRLEEEDRLNGRGCLNADQEIEKELGISNKKRKRISTSLTIVLVVSLIFSGKVIMSSTGATAWIENNTFFGKIKHLSPSAEKQLKGEENDRINIMLLGMGGEGHDGGQLTDTMILASIKPSTKEAALISFPRDMVSPVSNWRKINSIHAYAEQSEEGSGGPKTIEAMGKLLETPIDYYVSINFDGFADIIDELGGIEIEVENTFDDYSYPAKGQEDNPNYYARYEHLHFDAGKQTMNGETALKYARSRHAYGIEGSDFARAKRQQLVLEAVKNKLLSSSTLLNPVTVTKLINKFSQNVSTNLEIWEILKLWDIAKNVDRSKMQNKVLSDAPDNYLISSTGEDGAYILVPRSGSFSSIQKMVADIFPSNQTDNESGENNGTKETKKEKTVKPEYIKENASVAVFNGTWIVGLAGRKAATAKESGFTIKETGNAPERNYSQTIVYDLSNGEKSAALKVLKNITNAEEYSSWPDWVEEYKTASSGPDFILILGTDAEEKY